MRIMRNPLSRRTLLRGIGTTMALPLLEAMVPSVKAADLSARPKRLQIFYTPNGMIMDKFVPATTGADFALTPTLEPLAAHRKDITVISGLAHHNALALGDGPGGHGRSCGAYLTAAHPKRTEGFDLQCGVSMDQLVANRFADETQLPSLELGIEPTSLMGSCDVGYSCAYTNGLSWRSATVPMPVTVKPRDVLERLFGDGDATDEKSRLNQLRRQSSILDFVMDDARRLTTQLGANDKHKIAEYLDSTRDVERRIQKAMLKTGESKGADMALPAGIPDSFEEHVHLMIDLQILAMQADMTRVGSLMLGRELSNRTYPEIGVPDSHHMLSHHGYDPEKIAKLALINRYHMEQFAYYLKRLKDTKDGDGTLFDRTLVIAGASLGEPNEHDNMYLPAVVSGGLVQGNRHIAMAKHTPMANLLLSAMNIMGLPDTSFGDSSGPLRELALA